ncbi:type II-B CRISPR-associated RNA-guided endonuclease Cas9/Csx12 [Bathymodiolus thermophilus thioautotrophic gill symbiont]|uniref:CRISPR-associated protein, Csx12 family n=1 Tax=Bathymodiolus thermophilus thioautotrophic gill symbiont TaxID=2360 RepID=A0A8H8XEC6_9GAMM|nr:type II-B CRISPR-associated RNA-guided endonuclease Cas9/Csx12 [Bathymodiolus thermophilus thioautotrophic gill symbiont]CAB5506478.1 CRISPR-associated protein, Csx12 family [Bathymodiolus thermophilus thioautotrophic gill symbiont]
MSKIISPIAIDMGAKNTGVYLNHFEQGEDPTTSGNIQGKTIVIDSANITWSQADRTQKRHQIRTSKRRKLAKRLLALVLNECGIKPDLEQQQYLNGLLNRRGYTYLVEGLDENLIKQDFVAEYFVEKYSKFFKNKGSFYVDFLTTSNDIKKAKELQQVLTLSKNEAKKEIEESKENKQGFADAYDNIKSVLNTQIKAEDEGHKYRTIYLKNIEEDIKNSKLLKPLLSSFSAEKMARIVGNISNLQLRVLRKYFNDRKDAPDESMKSGDIWLPEKLHEVFFKWVRSWHTKQQNEKNNRTEILKLKGKDILDVLTLLDPKKTIPPYEDQNNRRPPKDLTLRLKPLSLNDNLKNWEAIAQLLADNYILPPIDERITCEVDIQEGLKDYTNPQKIKGKIKDTKERQILADTLHRILDRTITLDPYKLRWLTQESDTPDAKKAKDLLNQHSGNQADEIIVLAKKYYAEVEVAKQGLWPTNENTLFFRCNTNPPHKGKLTHKLVGHILRETFTEEKIVDFREQCWQTKIGRSTVKGMAKKIEDTRKAYGNGFNYIVQTIKKRQWVRNNESVAQVQKDRWDKYEQDYKDVVESIKNTDLIAIKINDFLDSNHQEKYNNPYSIAQLYNHLESEITGFSKTDKFNTEENAWRDKPQTITILNKANEEIEITKSNAMRLTADSIRPFDGLLDRIISRQAHEIVDMKIKQIEMLNIDKNTSFFVPIFMEQNRFKFEHDMADIKSNTKKKDNAKKGLEKQEEQWQEKNSRIKKNTYCPYTGEVITYGEIDHIIPQSQSKRSQDVVFNSEANLIYCSGAGNHNKGEDRWAFEQLKPRYLKEVFGDETNIKQNIIDFINGLDGNDSISFHNLEVKEQNYLRHALFITELDSKTFPLLNTRYKTFVNGTQGYLGKQIRKLFLRQEYTNIEVKTYQIDAQEVSQLRTVLGEQDKAFEKQERQGAFSHVVDASLVLATALQAPKIAEELTTTNVTELSEKGEWLKNLLPKDVLVQHIKRKPKYRKDLASTQIFKDGLYGERFMPILLDDEKLYYGFSLDNCVEIDPLKEPKKTVKEFDKKRQIAKEKQQTRHNEYFELLKPFLYTGKKNAKKSVSGDLSDNWQYQYLSIDKTKALNHLQKCAKGVCSDDEIEQVQQLEKLRYSIEKKKIKDVLVTGQGKKSFIKRLDDKKFIVSKLTLPAKVQWEELISHPIEDHDHKKTTLKKCFGKPEQIEIDNQDMVTFWQDLAKESNLDINYLQQHLFKRNSKGELAKKSGIIPKGVFDKKVKEETGLRALENSTLLKSHFGADFKVTADLIPQSSWNNLFQDFFCEGKIKNSSKHKQVRKEYSLPIVSNPSGGFRIRRKNPLTGEIVYQVSSIEGFATQGYDKTLKNPVLINGLKNSPNIASLDGRQVEVDNICYFDEWKEITIPEALEKKITFLSYAIGTKDRFNIRVSMPFKNFKELDNSINHFSNIPAEYKETNAWKFKETKLFDSDLLGKPRSNLFVEFVSEDKVTFSYIVDSTNQRMKEAYKID